MIDAVLRESEPGVPSLWIIDEVNSEGIPTAGREFPLATIANYRELLGIDDPMEVLEAIIHIQDHGEPDPCPETGRNPWTDPYAALRQREKAREDEAILAEAEGEPRSRILGRSSVAAYKSVHLPINGGRCLLDRVRAQARAELGLPDEVAVCGESSRLEPVILPEPRPTALQAMQPAGGKALLADLLQGQEEYLLECSQKFLHALSGHDRDPVTPLPEPPTPSAFEELEAKYQLAAALEVH